LCRHALLLRRIFEEGAHARQLPRRRSCAQPAGSTVRQESAEICSDDIRQPYLVDQRSPVVPEKIDEPMRSRGIGAHRMGGAPAVVVEVGRPAGGKRTRRMF
jgi:hypothetical protein